MRNFTKINKHYTHINTLFIQPTTYCALSCKGCYVKGWEKNQSESEIEHLSHSEWRQFMLYMSGLNPWLWDEDYTAYNSRTSNSWAHTNQMTFALDDVTDKNVIYMDNIFAEFLGVATINKKLNTGIEFHVTTRNIKNLTRFYLNSAAQSKLKSIDVVSISYLSRQHLLDIDFLRDGFPETKIHKKIHINWNLQADSVPKDFLEIAKEVDSIYFILHKPDLGQPLTSSTIKNYFSVLKDMKDILKANNIREDKINTDGCVQDAQNYIGNKTNGCSSNISRFQVWPDGSVSGCPYSQKSITPSASSHRGPNTLIGILDNIALAHKQYEFNLCKIPEALSPDSNRIISKKYSSLKIFED